MSISISNTDSACDRIHNLVKTSGLHFVINQTPWSSYITLRRKFINPGAYDVKVFPTEPVVTDQMKSMQERNEQLEHRLAEVEKECIDTKENYMKIVDHLHSKIDTLENKLEQTESNLKNQTAENFILEKEKKLKDEIIHNINANFNCKVSDLKKAVEDLETLKKTEKRAAKKLRQKAVKEAVKTNIDQPSFDLSDKDSNDNYHSRDSSKKTIESDILTNISEPSLPLPLASPSSPCSPARRPPPATPTPRPCFPAYWYPGPPPSPHTPPGSPPSFSIFAEQRSDPSPALSCYFVGAAPDLIEGSSGTTEPFVTTEYIKNISKFSLVPRQRRKDKS